MRRRHPDADVWFFDAPGVIADPPLAAVDPRSWTTDNLRTLNRAIADGAGISFPPARTHYGAAIPRHDLEGQGKRQEKIWRSDFRSGLSRFWSASMFPLVDGDMAGWPVPLDRLHPYYTEIADAVGLSGAEDGLAGYFPRSYVNRRPHRPAAVLEKFTARLDEARQPGVYAGVNRLGVETGEAGRPGCVRCGECFSGCFRNAIFEGAAGIARLWPDFQNRLVAERVLTVDGGAAQASVVTTHGTYGGFDRVFLAAGCIGSAEIMLRSMDLRERELPLLDSAVYLFAFADASRGRGTTDDSHLAIANTVLGLADDGDGAGYAHANLAPMPDLTWRCFVPAAWWPAFRGLSAALRRRIGFGKLYLDSMRGPDLSVRLDGTGELRIAARRGADRAAARAAFRRLRRAAVGTGFVIPPFPFMAAGTSSHYAGTMAYGSDPFRIGADGAVMPRVHVCDSAVFPLAPAQPPTFTIMANAARTCVEALDA